MALCCSWDRSAILWDVEATGSWDFTIRVWDLPKPTASMTSTATASTQASAPTSSSMSASTSADGALTQASTSSHTPVPSTTYSDYKPLIRCYIKDIMQKKWDTQTSWSWDKTVRMWNPRTGRVLHVCEGHEGWVQALVFSPDGTYLASASDDDSEGVRDVINGKCVKVLEEETDQAHHRTITGLRAMAKMLTSKVSEWIGDIHLHSDVDVSSFN